MIKLMHLSDLHFSVSTEDNIYSLEQLQSIEDIFKKEGKIDRLVVTGDLTHDGTTDAFVKAREWLQNTIPHPTKGPMGLCLKNQDILKIMPGNKDFVFKDKPNDNIEKRFYEGLAKYNDLFEDKTHTSKYQHFFTHDDKLKYDWFQLGWTGVYIMYLNTSFLCGKFDDDRQAKRKYVTYLCEKIKQGFHFGLKEQLIKSKATGEKIARKEFIASVKVLCCHHSFHGENCESDFIDEPTRQLLLSNLSLLDIQIQISGHGHVNCHLNKKIRDTFDKRAKNRYLLNYMKIFFNNEDNIHLVTEDERGLIARSLQILIDFFAGFYNADLDKVKLMEELERIANGDVKDVVDKVWELIRKNEYQTPNTESRAVITSFLNNLSKVERSTMTKHAQEIISVILKSAKHRTYEMFNAGAAGLTNSDKIKSSFNIYEIDSESNALTFFARRFNWTEAKQIFEERDRVILKYDDLKIPI